MKVWTQMLYGRYSCTPTTSDSVELPVLMRCLVEREWKTPRPKDMRPPVWPRMFACTACEASMYAKSSLKSVAPMMRSSLIVSWRKLNNQRNFFQSCSVQKSTRLRKKAIARSTSGRRRTHINIEEVLEGRRGCSSSKRFSERLKCVETKFLYPRKCA